MPKRQRISSRRARTESKKMFRQTVLMLIASVAIIIIFIFLVLPTLFKLISGQDGDNLFSTGDEIAPQVPTLSSPIDATNSAQLVLTGFSEKDALLYLIVNGEEKNKITIEDDQGKFEIDAQLEEGENFVKLYAEDEAQNQSDTTKEYLIVFDNKAPGLELETPTDGQEFELRKNQVIDIKGVTEPNSKVAINGRLTRSDNEGIFATTYQLAEGDNLLKFVISDKAGNQLEQEITVKFRF